MLHVTVIANSALCFNAIFGQLGGGGGGVIRQFLIFIIIINRIIHGHGCAEI